MRIVRRLLTVAVVASGLLVSGASMAAAAEPDAIPPPAVTVDRGTIFAGESVIVSGKNFGRGEIVDVVPPFKAPRSGNSGGVHGAALWRHCECRPSPTPTAASLRTSS
ncbi:MAG: hypothetical protein QOE61_1304 [Micromonosporaceae bacterium]|jgi:hypothetical protein|nr:hypothetical protein [Micromonosporaceae bacterium]